jgi:hypothetical protein
MALLPLSPNRDLQTTKVEIWCESCSLQESPSNWLAWLGSWGCVSYLSIYLQRRVCHFGRIPQFRLMDVVVPTFRLDLPFLMRICSLEVPRELVHDFYCYRW